MKRQLLKWGMAILPTVLFPLFSPLAARAQNCTPAPSGLIAWWPGDGFALDVAGTNNGTLQGGAGYAAGEVGQGFSLNGSSGYVQIPNNHQWAFGTNNFTIELWANFAATSGSRALISFDTGSGTQNKWIFWLNGGILQFHINGSPGTANIGTFAFSPVIGTWYHLVVTRNSTNYVFYTNGVAVATNVNTLSIPGTTVPLTIGQAENNFFFSGTIDEVSIFNRALASNEIAAVFQAGNSGMCYTNTPVPVFVQNPVGLTNYVAVAFSLTGAAMGTPRPQYQWLTNGVPLTGATNASLMFSNPTTNQSAAYSLVASNTLGSTTSSVANVTMLVPAFPAATEGFESGYDGWTTDNTNIWQVGVPAAGLGAAHSGTNCAGTGLTGNVPAYASTRLISPVFVVPAANQNPRLRWWQWFDFGSGGTSGPDGGDFQISTNNGTSWQTLASYGESSSAVGDYSGGWSEPSVDLSAYAGESVQIAFHFRSESEANAAGPGWFVDDVTLVTGPITTLTSNVPVGFESGLGDWSVDNGVWAIGVPTAGPGAAYDGTNCAGTGLTGNVPAYASTRLISPVFVVPAANQNPRLRWWQWFDFGSGNSTGPDGGDFQISTNDGASWQTLASYGESSTAVAGYSGGWSEPSIDLSAHAGESVQIAFHFRSESESVAVGPGWFVDNVTLVTGSGLQIVLITPISSPQLAGATFSPEFIQVQDQGTTVFNWVAPVTVTAYSTNGGSLHGTTNINVNLSTGSATFTNLYYSLASSNIAQLVTITFNSSALTPVTNPPIMVDFPVSEFAVSSSNSKVLIDPTSDAGVYSWTVNGADISYQHWYWLRIGSNTPQFSLDTLSEPYGLSRSSTNTTLNYLGQGLSATIAYSMTGVANGNSGSSMIESLSIQNITNATINLHVFEYSDYDLSDDPPGDTLTFPTSNKTVQQGNGLTLTETSGTPAPNYYEGSWYAITLDKLGGTSPVTLTDSLIPNLPGDQTFTHEWDTNLPAGQTLVISLTNSITGSVATLPVVLSVVMSGNTVIISWPTNVPSGFQLQTEPILTGAGNWSAVPNSPIISGNVYQVILPILSGAQYFRLQE